MTYGPKVGAGNILRQIIVCLGLAHKNKNIDIIYEVWPDPELTLE